MKKNVLIDLVLLDLNGGELNDESAILRQDIEAYLPAAVNYAMNKSYNINIQVEGNRDMSALFYGSFFDLPIVRELGRVPKIFLPKGTVALPRNQGIRYVSDGCGGTFAPLMDADLHTIVHYSKILPDNKFYRLKQGYIELWNISPIAETLNMEMIVSVEDLDDDDELPLQAGVEEDAINLCLQHFDPQRKTPADKINNTVDLNAQQQ